MAAPFPWDEHGPASDGVRTRRGGAPNELVYLVGQENLPDKLDTVFRMDLREIRQLGLGTCDVAEVTMAFPLVHIDANEVGLARRAGKVWPSASLDCTREIIFRGISLMGRRVLGTCDRQGPDYELMSYASLPRRFREALYLALPLEHTAPHPKRRFVIFPS